MRDKICQIIHTIAISTIATSTLFIEQRVSIEKIGYMDAVIDYCTINDVDIDNIGGLITPSLKQKIQIEAEDSNMMKPKGKLPI